MQKWVPEDSDYGGYMLYVTAETGGGRESNDGCYSVTTSVIIFILHVCKRIITASS